MKLVLLRIRGLGLGRFLESIFGVLRRTWPALDNLPCVDLDASNCDFVIIIITHCFYLLIMRLMCDYKTIDLCSLSFY